VVALAAPSSSLIFTRHAHTRPFAGLEISHLPAQAVEAVPDLGEVGQSGFVACNALRDLGLGPTP